MERTMKASMATADNKVAKKDKQQLAHLKKQQKSKDGIKKKTWELSVLCDIEACAVIVDDDGEVETWPKDQSAVMKMITRYMNYVQADAGGGGKKIDEHACDKGLLMIKDIVSEVDQKPQKMVLNLHSWDDHWIDGLPLESMQEVLGMVDTKLEAVARRMEVLNMVDEYIKDMGKEIVVFGEASEQSINQTPASTTFPGSVCLPGGESCLNQQIMVDPNIGWSDDAGSSFCFNNVVGSSGIDAMVNDNNQMMPSSFGGHLQPGFLNMQTPGFGGHLQQGFFNMQTPGFLGQESVPDQILFDMAPGMYPPPQFPTSGLFPAGQTTFGIWQNPKGLS